MAVSVSVTGYQSGPETSQTITSSLLYHEFAVPQHPGRAVPPSFTGLDSGDRLVNLLFPVHPTLRPPPAHQRNHRKAGARIRTRRFWGEGRRGVLPQQDAEAKHRGQAPLPHCHLFTPSIFSQHASTRVVKWCCCSTTASVSVAQVGQVMTSVIKACFHLISSM